jgi:uncharacterized protein YjiK
VAKKSVIDKLLALDGELHEAIKLEADPRVQAGLVQVRRAFSHLKDTIAQSEGLKWPAGQVARNKRGRP